MMTPKVRYSNINLFMMQQFNYSSNSMKFYLYSDLLLRLLLQSSFNELNIINIKLERKYKGKSINYNHQLVHDE